MSYTPVELRHVRVGRSLFGYNRATVEQLIEEVAQSFEATWRERGELSDKLEALEKQVAELRGRLGALQKDILNSNVKSLNVALENVTASESSIRDADFAEETAALTRAQILVQANTSVLAQANASTQSVLTLLQR